MGQRALGTWLVALQMAIIAGLGLAALVAIDPANVPVAAWLLAAAGAAIGLSAVAANRPGNFNIRPDPRPGGRLIVHGPYRWIRHPMYTAVIALGAACAAAVGTVWGWAGAGALVVVLGEKAGVEERALLVMHPGYADYRARTKRFLPWLI